MPTSIGRDLFISIVIIQFTARIKHDHLLPISNYYRLTEVYKKGLYDLLVNVYPQMQKQTDNLAKEDGGLYCTTILAIIMYYVQNIL